MPFAVSFCRPKDQPIHTPKELARSHYYPPGSGTAYSINNPSQRPNRFFIEQRDVEIRAGEIPFEPGVGGEVDP